VNSHRGHRDRAFRLAERGDHVTEEEMDALLHQRGWLARIFKPLFRVVSWSWHLYPIGLLFALGFETASEISLFGLAAQASNAVSSWSLLIFPALFAAGMTLADTTDGVTRVWHPRAVCRELGVSYLIYRFKRFDLNPGLHRF
jgi:HoxN/HupN/NixA family high-affinity nickel-transporter